MEADILKKAIKLSKDILKMVVENGDIAVDCTAGNGKDTIYLSELIGKNGKVYSFDIQEKAIDNTKKALMEKELLNRTVLICDGHENILQYVKEDIKCAVFNLGYLPGGDHSITTLPQNVIKAIEGCLELLQPGGIITIVCYTGYDGGKIELNTLINYLSNLDQKKYSVANYKIINQINEPPQLLVIEKHKQG